MSVCGSKIEYSFPGLTEAKIDGTWYPGVIDFALVQWESEVASIAGTVTDDSTVSGTFVMPVPVTGTWQGADHVGSRRFHTHADSERF